MKKKTKVSMIATSVIVRNDIIKSYNNINSTIK